MRHMVWMLSNGLRRSWTRFTKLAGTGPLLFAVKEQDSSNEDEGSSVERRRLEHLAATGGAAVTLCFILGGGATSLPAILTTEVTN